MLLQKAVRNSKYSFPHNRLSNKVAAGRGTCFHTFSQPSLLTNFDYSSGGTICLQSTHWNNPAFPQPLIFDCINQRKGLLMHNKVSAHSPTIKGSTHIVSLFSRNL